MAVAAFASSNFSPEISTPFTLTPFSATSVCHKYSFMRFGFFNLQVEQYAARDNKRSYNAKDYGNYSLSAAFLSQPS
jgi:hypothetical protein